MPQALEQALELIRENRPDSLDRALALLQNTVYSFSMKVCGHPQGAEDTMQDVLLKSIPYLAEFDTPQALMVWLYKVARNRCISSHRGSNLPHQKLVTGRVDAQRPRATGTSAKRGTQPGGGSAVSDYMDGIIDDAERFYGAAIWNRKTDCAMRY